MVTDVLALLSPTLKFGGAAASSVTVPVTLAPTFTSARLNVTDLTWITETVSAACLSVVLPLRLALSVALPGALTPGLAHA